MAGETIDPEVVAGLARTLDRLAPEFTEAERRQLLALLAAGAAAEVEPFDMTSSFSDAMRPLIVTTAIGMSQAGSGPAPPSTTTPSPSGASGSGKK